MEWACFSSMDVMFVEIDFEKAYDKFDWHFILAMLKDRGFGDVFPNNDKTLFASASWVTLSIDANIQIQRYLVPFEKLVH